MSHRYWQKGLEDRFWKFIRTESAARGERRFTSKRLTRENLDPVKSCLERLVPWDSHHTITDDRALTRDGVAELDFSGGDGDQETHIELNRMHAFFCPPCYSRLLKSLRIPTTFEDTLMIPEFSVDCHTDPPKGDRKAPPMFDASDLDHIHATVGRDQRRRETAASGALRVRVDGREQKDWALHLPVNRDASVVDVIGSAEGHDVTLATCLISADDEDSVANFELVLPFPDVRSAYLRPVPGHADILLDAIGALLATPRPQEWVERLRRWQESLQTGPLHLDAISPGFGFASELRAGDQPSHMYDVILTPDHPVCQVDLSSAGEIFAAVEGWRDSARDPLVLLAPRGARASMAVLAASMDSAVGAVVARFPDVPPGTYLLCLEPQDA